MTDTTAATGQVAQLNRAATAEVPQLDLTAAADPEDTGVAVDNDGSSPEPETFPREYVEKLRQEAADARVKAKKAEDYARALFHARVAATGRLADPSDLPFNPDLLDDEPALAAAIDKLISEHPHYAARTPRGDVGQGATSAGVTTVDLAGLLRARA